MAGIKDRKLYVAALGVALGGLVLDRFVFSGGALGPGTAQAAPADAPEPVAALLAGGATSEPDSVAVLAERLQQLEQDRDLDLSRVRNAFWLDGVSTASAHGEQAGDIEQRINKFRESHKLRAVMNGPNGTFVVVGKERVELGGVLAMAAEDRTDLFTLVDIQVDQTGRRAVFDFDGHTVALQMDSPNSAGTGGDAQDHADAGR